MKELNITTNIKVLSYDELTEEQQELTDMAKKETDNAYAPYSNFFVGAAALLANGEIFAASNQENAAYPSGLCAERVTLFYANSKFPDVPVKTLAIVAKTNGEFVEECCAPCGACRQVILETEFRGGEPIEILLCGRDQVYLVHSIKDLLPLCFTKDSLERG